jgi:His/Glu/Gln/Arg/opine family amino acid ABC transporter permease subunit
MSMSMTNLVGQLASGMLVTVEIFVVTLLASLPLGLLIAFGRMSNIKPLQWLIRIYISIMRGTPLMLQLMVVYFGPYYIFGMRIDASYRLIATFLAFAWNYAAYFAEIYRGGIESIPRGQYEAAKVLGYGRVQTFVRIIFPQVCKRILPSITNEVITLVKDTSLAFAIAVAEMFTTAKQIAAAQTSVVPLIAAGVFYYIFNLIVALVMEKLEKKMNVYQ